MPETPRRVLICSSRTSVGDALAPELEAMSASATVVRGTSDWPDTPPAIAFLDLEQGTDLVREAREALGAETRFVAVVDNDSASRLIGAFAAGCDDYLFFPINRDELALVWRKHAESTPRPALARSSSDRIAFEFPSDVAYLEDAVAQIVRACEERRIAASRAKLNLRVALGEAVANAILYGNRQDPFKRVRVRAEFASDRVAVTVTDEGSGFDPSIVPDPTRPENRGRSHGRGLFLLHSLMDEVRYNEAGNAVTLVLRSQPSRTSTPSKRGRASRVMWADGFSPIIEAFERACGCGCRVVVESDGDRTIVHDSIGEGEGWKTSEAVWEIDDSTVLAVRVGSSDADPDPALQLLGVSLAKLAAGEREIGELSQELVERHEEVDLLASISGTLGSVMQLREAAHHILGDVVRITGARRAGLWVHEPADRRLVLIAAAGDGEPARRELAVDDRGSYTARVFASQEPLLVTEDEDVLSVPVTYQPPDGSSRRLGVLNLVGPDSGEGFTSGERRLLAAIATRIGAAIEHARLVEESIHQERITAELALAHEMQLKLLPDLGQFQDVADVAGRFEPAESVGGDLYQLVRLPEGRLGVLLGDVSSHGVSAALIMTLTMSAATIVGREGKPPGEVLRRIHSELLRELESTEMYMTIFYGVIDPARGELCYANAGHPHAFRIGGHGPERLSALDPPLGILGLESYSESRVPWSATDVLLLFTDGLAQCFPEEALFSDERLAWCASPDCADGATRAVDALYDLHTHADDCPVDDRTALAVRMRSGE